MKNGTAYGVLQYMLSLVIQEYPRQALWLFTAVAKSTTLERASRSQEILSKMVVGFGLSLSCALFTSLHSRI